MSDWSSWPCGTCGNDPCSCSILTPGHGHFDGPFSRSSKKTERQELQEENERLRKEVARLKKKLKEK